MKKRLSTLLIICGWLMLAAFPVLAQVDDPVEEIKINKRPFKDLAGLNLEKVEKDKVDLSKPFKVVFEGILVKKVIKTEDGKDLETVGFDENKSKWIKLTDEEAGDVEVGKIAKETVQAVGDSGFFAYLYNFGIKDFKITLAQNNEKISFIIESEQPTEERAKTFASGLNALLSMAAIMVKKGTDEQILLENAKNTPPTSKGKNVIINFEMPKDVAQEMIERNLAAYKNKKLSEQK